MAETGTARTVDTAQLGGREPGEQRADDIAIVGLDRRKFGPGAI